MSHSCALIVPTSSVLVKWHTFLCGQRQACGGEEGTLYCLASRQDRVRHKQEWNILWVYPNYETMSRVTRPEIDNIDIASARLHPILEREKYRPAPPLQLCTYVTLRVPSLDSETGWTWKLWPNINLLQWEKDLSVFCCCCNYILFLYVLMFWKLSNFLSVLFYF